MRLNPMRVCFLCNEYPPGPHGGIGTFTQMLARSLVQAGHQAWVIGKYSQSHPGSDYEEDQGVRVWRLRGPGHRLGLVWARYRLFRTVAHWSRNGKIDLIDVPDSGGWIAGWPRLPVPIIARLHCSATYLASELGQPVSRMTFLLERASLRRADFWCSVSRFLAHKAQQLFGLRTDPAILYNPVEVPFETCATTRSRNQVVFTGTLTANKGILSLINAWPRVTEVYPEAALHIFGKDRLTDKGQSMQAFLLSGMNGQIRKSVHFHGHVTREKIFHALQMARLAVFPSYAEAFAIAPMEAMACGCPTIYSHRTSGPELIEHDHNGFLIDPDHPDEIADAIIRLLTDDDLAKRLGDAGRKRIQDNFSIPAMTSKNEAFYRNCLSKFRRMHLPVRG